MKMTSAGIKYLAVHCSATKPSMNIGRDEIYTWHRRRGMRDVGYHYIIRRNGMIEKGRNDDTPGAHVRGYNTESLGICMVGGVDDSGASVDNYELEQYVSLAKLLEVLKLMYPNAAIQGHRDFPNVAKDCPCFDVKSWYYDTVTNNAGTNPIDAQGRPALVKG